MRLGETIQRAGCDDPRSAATHILVGVPEDIGIRANGGRGGAASPPTRTCNRALFNCRHLMMHLLTRRFPPPMTIPIDHSTVGDAV